MNQKWVFLFVLFISFGLLVVSCSKSTDKSPKNPTMLDDNNFDLKTYSTSKDIWKADPSASCGSKIINSDSTMTYGIDLSQNYYWEVTELKENGKICRIRHLYLIVVSTINSGLEMNIKSLSISSYSETGVLIPQLYRKKCTELANNSVSDTGDQPNSSDENRIIHILAMKDQLILSFDKSPLCQDNKLTLKLIRQ
jgi:hypothetical protein